MKKILFFLLVLTKLYCINLPDINSNERLIEIFKNDLLLALKNGDKDGMLYQILRDGESMGIDIENSCFDINEKFLNSLKVAFEKGDLYSFKNISEMSEEYLDTPLSITMLQDLSSILQKGANNALNNCDLIAYYEIVKIAKENDIDKIELDNNALKAAVQTGFKNLANYENIRIIKSFIDPNIGNEENLEKINQFVSNDELLECFLQCLEKKYDYYLSYDLNILFKFAAYHNIDINKYDFNAVFEKSIVNSNPFYLFPAIKNAQYVCKKINKKFDFSQIPNIENFIYKNIYYLLSEGIFQFFKNNHITIDFSKVENLPKIFDHNPFCTFNIKTLKEIANKYKIEIDYSYYIKKQKKIYEYFISEVIDNDFSEDLVKDCLKRRNQILKILEDAKENGININVKEIPKIKKLLWDQLYDLILYEEIIPSQIDEFINLAKFFDIPIEKNDVIRKMISETNHYDINKYESELRNYGIETDISLIKDLEPEILEGMINSIMCNNKGLMNDFIKYLSNFKIQPDLRKALEETIRRYISSGLINDFEMFDNFSKKLHFEINLHDIENIEDAFYKGLQNASNENNQFVYYYLLEFAKVNQIILNTDKIEKCDGSIKNDIILAYFDSYYKFNTSLLINASVCGKYFADTPYMTDEDINLYYEKFSMYEKAWDYDTDLKETNN